MTTDNESPLQFCDRLLRGFSTKADDKKAEALACFLLVIVSTLSAPLFVTLGPGIFWGKVVPSVLSLAAAGATAWLQLRKPQQLWTMYWSAQRELEDHRTRFAYAIEPYQDTSSAEKLLIKEVADIAIGVHRQWVPLVPTPEKLKDVETKRARK